MIAIIDYGVGNLLAIQNIIKKAGGESVITDQPAIIENAEKLILPGVGAFSYGIQQLKNRNLVDILNEQVLVKKKMILGLCLGAQLMTRQSEEGGENGFGWVDAVTKKFDETKVAALPHMNWADIDFKKPSLISKNLEHGSRFYFVHSYHFSFNNSEQILATSHYGYDFTCAFETNNIYGVQFHPEKSHKFGVTLFQNFIQA